MTSLPQVDYKKEVRFAVVMYGGVSLAIYINGVTQELFKMVRSTARAGEGNGERAALSGSIASSIDNNLVSTERVYRKISHLLSDERELRECRELADAAVESKENGEKLKKRLDDLIANNRRPVQTGFIVDILSGTSAGGINSIYLAKALANEQRIDRLKQLWINEGDLGLLLNDRVSVEGTDLLPQEPPQSLLNSRRMYLKLLHALDDMDRDNPNTEKRKSPYTSELDLFITATDIEGVPVPLKLSDKIVYERRHRNVFHFEYQHAEDANDFLGDSNPFLAFAARCTSSFPFAFEPMRLTDIDEVLELLPDYRGKPQCRSDSPKWKRYFREIVDPLTGVPNLRFSRRSFGDGGYLDNKPFSFAIEALVRRQSDVPVDRRLIYIEPSPEHPEDIPLRDFKPDALANVKAALLDLPTYETIREDLQRVLQRNQLIDRVLRITSGIEKDINAVLPRELKDRLEAFIQNLNAGDLPDDDQKKKGQTWAQKNLTAMVKEKGRAYLSYQKLRIAAVTDELARLMARLLNFDANSDLQLSLRCLVRAWREARYFEDREPTLNQFLTDYDYSHRIRRLTFIREKIDTLYDYPSSLQKELRAFADKHREVLQLLDNPQLNQDRIQRFRNENPHIGWLLGLLRSGASLSELNDEQKDQLRDVLIVIKCEVNEVYKNFQKKARLLRQRRAQTKQNGVPVEVNPILAPFEAIGIKPEHLNGILDTKNLEKIPGRLPPSDSARTPNEDDCNALAKQFLEQQSNVVVNTKLREAAEALRIAIATTVEHGRSRMKELLNPREDLKLETEKAQRYYSKNRDQWQNAEIVKSVREYLNYYYNNFEEYDQISFPIFYQADVGEASIVEVIRVSPEDAISLINEREEKKQSPDGVGRQKLAGVALHHFGAFLDRTWRQNDIMWGRLDGAERLISSLLPGTQNEKLRDVLITEAHTSILIDELPPESRLQLGGLVSEALVRASAGEPMERAVAKVTEKLKKDMPVRTKLEAIIRASLDNEELLEFIRTGYEVNRKLDPKPMLTSISRSTQIIGKVFENVANANQLDGKSLAWIARLGQIFWGLVEIAVPNTIRNMLFNHWLSVIYAFELFTIIVGLILSSQAAQQFGWTALGITAVLNILVLVLKDVMRGRHAVFRLATLLVCGVLLILAALGLIEILGPVFNVHWGPGDGQYPRDWLKDALRQRLPSAGFVGRNLFSLLGLFVVAVVVVLLNLFGLISFSWIDKRWELVKSWLRQSRFRTFWLWRPFKPIKILADYIEDRTREFAGKTDLYLLPFWLSGDPPTDWKAVFETKFKQQVDAEIKKRFQSTLTDESNSELRAKREAELKAYRAPQLSVNNREALVMATSGDLDNVFVLLRKAAADANRVHEENVQTKALGEYKNRKRMLQDSETLNPDMDRVPEAIRTKLKQLRLAATSKMSRWPTIAARFVGVLTVVMSLGILYTLGSTYREVSLPGGFHSPGIALQLAHSPEEAQQAIRVSGVLEGQPPDSSFVLLAGKERLVRNILTDWLAIFHYLLTLALISYWLSRGREPDRHFASTAGIAVFVAAIFDVLENNATLALLGRTEISTDAVRLVFIAATVKWLGLFLTLAMFGFLLWRRKQPLFRVVAVLLLLAALTGAVGVAGYRLAVELGFWLMALSLFPVGLLFLLAPKKLEGNPKRYITLHRMVSFR